MGTPKLVNMKRINTVGVIGSGTMGSALAQKFAQEGFSVVLIDRENVFLEKGISSIKNTLQEGVDRNVFTQEKADSILNRILPSTNFSTLINCEIVIEAIFENFEAKAELFKTISNVVSEQTIIATNTSSFSVTDLSKFVTNPERFIGLHYFYHAAKNRLVEIIPGELTTKETIDTCYIFSLKAGKDPIFTKDVYGFAINRFFVPWLNESTKLLKENLITVDEVDQVSMKTFGIGMGPFALMNATGVSIALHAQRTLEFFGPSYKVSEQLIKQVDDKINWKVNINVDLEIQPTNFQVIQNRLLGCVFFVCSQILNENICSAIDLNKGAKIGLKWKYGPIDLMAKIGEIKVKKLVDDYCKEYGESIPNVSEKNWFLDQVTLEIINENGLISFNKPEDLNALNENVINQLEYKFDECENNPAIKNIFITGNGKAFVAGADIKFFIENIKSNSIKNIESFTKNGQRVFSKIDLSKKKVIVLINGMALGGGMELALCADILVASPKSVMAFPETGIGIYPGLGGTQRTTRRIGKGLAKYLILTGKMLNSTSALEIGLIDKIYSIDEMFEMINGKIEIPSQSIPQLSHKWNALSTLFYKYSYKEIINNDLVMGNHDPFEISKMGQVLKQKAPIALDIAEKLIEMAKGTESELEHLETIFKTNDALLGLSSIGKKVTYEGK